ncbi:hypothetical protein PMPD1_2507 [Paramixta manurensis]|uniref:Uncharacterized protein n=1 Tax=Paramixta manurensis TaxID=2740817 RepID=A0A6M8UCI8_9GAMM|nr:hypothetical protein PMPD1_2507 [Erwiniaceae bacterium PD-1]
MEDFEDLIFAAKDDDGCDHTQRIIWMMHQRANIRRGIPWTPCPLPIKIDPFKEISQPTTLTIGVRRTYSRNVAQGIYQLYRRGCNENNIASMLGIPLDKIRVIMEHKTQTQRRAWQLVQQASHLPTQQEIISRLSKERPA